MGREVVVHLIESTLLACFFQDGLEMLRVLIILPPNPISNDEVGCGWDNEHDEVLVMCVASDSVQDLNGHLDASSRGYRTEHTVIPVSGSKELKRTAYEPKTRMRREAANRESMWLYSHPPSL